jgi:hypothetical protein
VRVEKFGFDELAADLERAGADITKQVAKVTGMACNKMKRDAQRRVQGHSHLPHLARSFTYDVRTLATKVVGEVGAEHERPQGKLDVFVEFGSPTSAPIPHWRPAADKEVPVWIGFLEKVAVDAIGEGR